MRPASRALVFVVFAALGLALGTSIPAAPLQDAAAADRQAEFLATYRSLADVQDVRGISRLASKDMRTTEDVLLEYSFKIVQGGPSAADEAELLITAADEAEDGTRFRKRFDRLKPLDEAGLTAWSDAYSAWSKAANIFAAANQKREQSDFRRALIEMDAALAAAQTAKDPELAAIARYHCGFAHEQLGAYGDAILAFETAMDEWLVGGRPKEAMYRYMVDKRRELIEKGHDPREAGKAADGGGGSGAKRNSTTSYKEGSVWLDFTTAYKEMKDPSQIASTSPWGLDQVLLWREFTWNDKSKNDFGILVKASPFGKPLTVVREAAKGFFDLDGDGKESKGDSPVKVIDGRPTLNSLKSGDGKDADRYAFFMLSGGQGQTWFQTIVNYQNSGRYRIGCYREAKLLNETVLFIDDNCSGAIGDPSDQGDNLWRGNPRFWDNDALVIGKAKPQPWSDIVFLAGKWCCIRINDPLAKQVRVRELELTTGQVLLKWIGPVPPKMLVVAEVGDMKGSFFDIAGGAPVNLPAGQYEIAYGRVESGKPGQMKQAWIFKGDCPSFEVKAGETTTLEHGGPYTLDFRSKVVGKAIVVQGKDLIIKDKAGAILGRIYDEVPYCDVAYRKKGGAPVGRPKTMSKISSELSNTDNVAAWFPADFAFDNVKADEVEIQLTLKKHSLLGGPFASEWK
ncbi:MAG: hypothetical protein EXS13_14030 [Planctomycetes bacterium]|nr:hypothetical protein [Planctomycetota bacterium]